MKPQPCYAAVKPHQRPWRMTAVVTAVVGGQFPNVQHHVLGRGRRRKAVGVVGPLCIQDTCSVLLLVKHQKWYKHQKWSKNRKNSQKHSNTQKTHRKHTATKTQKTKKHKTQKNSGCLFSAPLMYILNCDDSATNATCVHRYMGTADLDVNFSLVNPSEVPAKKEGPSLRLT